MALASVKITQTDHAFDAGSTNEFLMTLLETVRTTWTDGDYPPRALIVTNTGGPSYADLGFTPFSGPAAKAATFAFLQESAKSVDAVAVVFISEVWLAVYDDIQSVGPGAPGYLKPRDHPNRIEALSLSLSSRVPGVESTMWHARIQRPDDKPAYLDEWEQMRGVGGTLTDFLSQVS